ncbi:MAG: TonB-dependent receptor, partial [Candidatus Eremiobacteraeota bacterium]|nr:TonB-dependent receptor [Candidatus Eremiobacteraeota bacterium]
RSHTVRAGGQVDQVTVPKHYLITLQPGNQLSPTGAAYTVSDTNTNRGFTGYFYLQDSWKLAPAWQLDYGFRYNAFTIASTSFANEYNQLSPRIKLTKFFGERASAYLYYGRLFVPFSFENVDPVTASQLYVNGNAPGVTFDLKPQRDSLYEAGFHVPVGPGDLGFRISHKNSTDWIDDTQVGSTNLHQDINFPRGVVNVQSIAYQTPSTRRSKAYASVSHVVAQNSANCETQLLQNCALGGPPGGDWVQADHDQHYTVNGGIILNDRTGGWFSATLEYGSGLSTDPASCFPEDAVNCKVPPHTTLDLAKSFAVGKGAVVLSLDNAFNDRYAITLKNSLQGTHYAGGRALRAQYLLGRP